MGKLVDSRVLCVVHDKKAETYGELVTFDSDAAAVRAFGDLLADNRSMVGRHPEDFQLVRIGFYDHLHAALVPCDCFVLADGFSYERGDKHED